MPNFVSTANFSSSNAGLATVGYKVFNLDGSQFAARTTTNVVELGTSTGIYRTIITYPPFFQGFVLWDTGTGSPVYASESINPQDADPVLDGVRTQLRSLNTSLSAYLQKTLKQESVDKLIKKLDNFKLDKPDHKEVLDALSTVREAVDKINISPVVDFRPEVKPEIKVDLSASEGMLQQIKELFKASEAAEKASIEEFRQAVINIKKETAEALKAEAKRILGELSGLESRQSKVSDNRLQVLTNTAKQMLNNFETKLEAINKAMEQKLKAKEDYETKLAALKDNMRDILAAQLDVKQQAKKVDEDSLKFIMATYRG